MMPPKDRFVNKIALALRRRCGLRKTSPGSRPHPTRLIVATSGGADSVALLRAIVTLGRTRPWGHLQPTVGHVQHNLRGTAEADAAFVESLAQMLEVPFHRRDLDLSAASGNLEAQARTQRYRALADIAAQVDARHVVTAHHGDDQLETLLMRLLRGSSVRGLSCMAWRRPLVTNPTATDRGSSTVVMNEPKRLWLIRPMLAVDRAQVLAYLNEIEQPWREDHTNADRSRLRSRLRHDVLPTLKSIHGGVTARAVKTADHFRQLDRLLERQIHEAKTSVVTGDSPLQMDRKKARLLPSVVLSGLLRRCLKAAGVRDDRISHHALEPIITATRDRHGGHRVFALSGGVQVVVTADRIHIERRGSSPAQAE